MVEQEFTDSLYHYKGTLDRPIDGDTFRVRLDLGLYAGRTISVRIRNINAPELFSGTEKEAGIAARNHLTGILAQAKGGTIYIRTYKDAKSFDRYVGDVFITDLVTGEWIDVGERMIRDGFAETWP